MKEALAITKPRHVSVKMEELANIMREVMMEKEKYRELESQLQFYR